ncbi:MULTISPECIES: hypothetical protein [unclassified Beijerinckia]|uniref:hypothetical protein n=1 Tax=unclassified Beijerinckia TaxID=2638183 RepID=UPI00089CA6BF|nr:MULTISPECIES: hypothetical protein [unclassified Beijerinckia]MDH7798323.1 hypothetical protein [Beijerinckia sp. GAS462]SED17019.1 hypothetical protein SAMN05443249_4619 [Beijerinckia sp. 28-YEA-48]
MSQLKLDPAFKRMARTPRVGGSVPLETPKAPRLSWPKLAASAFVCILAGAAVVLSWPQIAFWLGLAR